MKKQDKKTQRGNIHTNVQFYLDEVELNLAVKEDLTAEDDILKNFGYIQVSTGYIDNEDCLWDGINFFLNCRKKEFKEKCKTELTKKGFKDWKKIYKTIKTLLKRAKKLNLITE